MSAQWWRAAPVAVEATNQAVYRVEPEGRARLAGRPVFSSWGTLDGKLGEIHIHRDQRFTLYEAGRENPVRGALPDEWIEEAKRLLGLAVRVHGLIRYRGDGRATSVSAVTQIEELQRPDRDLSDFLGAIPNITRGLPAGEYVRRLRAGGDD